MEQNTDEWKKWRHAGLGSSDANIYMGVSKYKKRAALILEKQTPYDKVVETDAGPVAALGHVIEEMERTRFELMNDKKFPPTLAQSTEIPFLRASYDGLDSSEEEAWEHKLMGESMFNEVLAGKCPDEYYPQIQQQFFVKPTLKRIYLCCVKYEKEMLKGNLDPSKFERGKLVVERDLDYINNKLLPEAKKTWEEILANRDWSELIKVSKKRTRIKDLIKKLEDKAKSYDPFIIDNLKEAGGSLATPTFSFSYRKQSKVSLDTTKMEEDGIDLKKYAKTTEFFVLTVKEKKKK